MMKLSQGLAETILADLKTRLANCTLHLFTQDPPAGGASAAEVGTLLTKITLNGGTFNGGSPTNGLNFDVIAYDEANGVVTLSKAVGEEWKGLGIANGTPGYGRIYDNALVTGESDSALRIDGIAALSSGDFALSSSTVKIGVPIGVDTCIIRLSLYKK